jgi:hypothetical protein
MLVSNETEHRAMEETLKKLAETFGFVVPFGYGAAAYGLFHWLDENASDEAKAALARTMLFKEYKNEQVASALVEVFDRIYTYPLLGWRAFFRSLVFTTLVLTIYLLETEPEPPWKWRAPDWTLWTIAFLFNILSDYLSLFVIRPLLVRSGTKPVIGLSLGAASGAAIVLVGNLLREVFIQPFFLVAEGIGHSILAWLGAPLCWFAPAMFRAYMITSWPALAVFVWLPLFALGILIVRLLTPLSWVVGRTQWFLKEGKEHPLKAVGSVAAVVVFLGTVAVRAVFSAQEVGHP